MEHVALRVFLYLCVVEMVHQRDCQERGTGVQPKAQRPI